MAKKTNNEKMISTEENSDAVATEVTAVTTKESKAKKTSKKEVKKENIFKRIWKKIVKFCKDTVGEMKKVTWTSKDELAKSTKLVLVSVIAIALVIAVIDTGFAYLINWLAGLVG